MTCPRCSAPHAHGKHYECGSYQGEKLERSNGCRVREAVAFAKSPALVNFAPSLSELLLEILEGGE